ncbi:hypothetical protein FA592_05900 [Sulfurospirillum diekertiae]|uniref:Uncharacterized protein n=1 Tax=Sulfurospirillum diekertiae TaxID=1854492 RepID=A0A6G9VS46_9BACT|nr:hypothetical protein [Sulfurospirillum diekertiae]QIR75787.1 hypothetical protein FA584_06000 [Sulfurospirillum diekertiae]QIR78432.1 hypothetical protein FA592_05900 [Sulfurospirillum diekertiae]
MKKILLGALALLVVAAGVLFLLKGKDTYEGHTSSVSLSDGLNVGSTISYTLFDQFGKAHTLDDSIHTLILVFAKDTGHAVKAFLGAQSADYLTTHHAAFVADISPMPVVIRNTFALPDLKTQPYSVNLILDETIATSLKKGAKVDGITVVTLKNKQVEKVAYIENAEALKAMIEKEN